MKMGHCLTGHHATPEGGGCRGSFRLANPLVASIVEKFCQCECHQEKS